MIGRYTFGFGSTLGLGARPVYNIDGSLGRENFLPIYILAGSFVYIVFGSFHFL